MRVKQMKKQMRVYMNPQDYDTMIDSADSRRAEVAMRCMGEMGLRVSEVADIKMEHIRESTHKDVDILFLTVYGKDTSGNSEDGKRRDVWLPRNLYERLQTYASNENRSDNHPLILKTKRTIQDDIEKSRDFFYNRGGYTTVGIPNYRPGLPAVHSLLWLRYISAFEALLNPVVDLLFRSSSIK